MKFKPLPPPLEDDQDYDRLQAPPKLNVILLCADRLLSISCCKPEFVVYSGVRCMPHGFTSV